MGFLDAILGKGAVKGVVSIQNGPANRQLLIVGVYFAEVAPGAPPPAQLKDAFIQFDGRSGAFEGALKAGHYHVLISWVRYVVEGGTMLLDRQESDDVWATKQPIVIEKGKTRHLNLKPDFHDFLRSIGQTPPPPGRRYVIPG